MVNADAVKAGQAAAKTNAKAEAADQEAVAESNEAAEAAMAPEAPAKKESKK